VYGACVCELCVEIEGWRNRLMYGVGGHGKDGRDLMSAGMDELDWND